MSDTIRCSLADCSRCLWMPHAKSNKISDSTESGFGTKDGWPTKQGNKLKETVKVILIVMIPIVALVAMTTDALIASKAVYTESQEAETAITYSLQVFLLKTIWANYIPFFLARQEFSFLEKEF